MAKNIATGQPEYDWDSEGPFGAPVDMVARNDFQLGQDYEKEPAKTLVCRKCGGDRFIVGQGSRLTVIKCPSCGWEASIHDG